MIATEQNLEDLTLTIKQEIHVQASLETTFAALLEPEGSHYFSDRPLGTGEVAQNLPPAGLSNRVEGIGSGARSCHDETLHAYMGICQVRL